MFKDFLNAIFNTVCLILADPLAWYMVVYPVLVFATGWFASRILYCKSREIDEFYRATWRDGVYTLQKCLYPNMIFVLAWLIAFDTSMRGLMVSLGICAVASICMASLTQGRVWRRMTTPVSR